MNEVSIFSLFLNLPLTRLYSQYLIVSINRYKVKHMRRKICLLTFNFLVLAMCSVPMRSPAQQETDSLANALKSKILGKLNNFTFGLYIDAYYNWTIMSQKDTSNVIPFSGNCPVQDQIRMNVAALEFYYNAEKVRGKLAIQYGDAPNLLAAPEMQFIKTLRQANFGFRIVKDLWLDFGYMLNPIGIESSWPVINQISVVTVGGYYEPGSVLGAKLSYRFSPKFSGGLMIGNPFSLAYSQNTHMAGIVFLTYEPWKKLSLTYNNFFGNQALVDAEVNNDIVYNNIIIRYFPTKSIDLTGQFDFAVQTNSQLPPDTNKTALMCSGFVQANYQINKLFALTARFEYLYDPHGFLTGFYTYNDKVTGLSTRGFTVSFEYKPVSFGYIRAAYRYLHANNGNKVFYSNTTDFMQSIIFTTGVRF